MDCWTQLQPCSGSKTIFPILEATPEMVTIGGQSADSSVVHDLTASPLAKGLFWAAIAESGSGVSSPKATRTLQEAELDGQAYAKLKGVSSLAELRRLPAEQFIPVTPVPGGALLGRTSPNIDGWFLPASVSQIFADGTHCGVVSRSTAPNPPYSASASGSKHAPQSSSSDVPNRSHKDAPATPASKPSPSACESDTRGSCILYAKDLRTRLTIQRIVDRKARLAQRRYNVLCQPSLVFN
jgi:hypothetical protein